MDIPKDSAFLANLHHAFAQTNGTYALPNSLTGDLLKTAKREVEALLQEKARLDLIETLFATADQEAAWREFYTLAHSVGFRKAADTLLSQQAARCGSDQHPRRENMSVV